ncbi:hypothetical protein [Salinimonas chungwhensis]|uniref:hypothetical protein n=1 Tax=Salinimonas chungwhensis TaxID=265425 RepID=UPI0003A84650|nr:hypothetical protein [Salinimonas chungwhensis]
MWHIRYRTLLNYRNTLQNWLSQPTAVVASDKESFINDDLIEILLPTLIKNAAT